MPVCAPPSGDHVTVVTPAGAEPGRADRERTRVVTVTPAPSIDRVYVVDALRTGSVNRAHRIEVDIGGNGVNLARDLRAAGNDVVAVVPLDLESVVDLVDDASLFRVVPVAHRPRANTVIVGSDGVTTNVNQAATPLTAPEWRSLRAAAAQEVRRLRPDWVVVGGTVPAGAASLDPGPWADLAGAGGGRLCLDSPGAVVAGWIERGVVPDLVSPNLAELEDATGRRIGTMGDVLDAAARLIDRGVGAVLVSLGARGAVLVDGDDIRWARTPPALVVNTTGAGDAALAGLVSRWNGDRDGAAAERALTDAVRWGRAAVSRMAPTIAPDEVDCVRVAIDAPPRSLRVD